MLSCHCAQHLYPEGRVILTALGGAFYPSPISGEGKLGREMRQRATVVMRRDLTWGLVTLRHTPTAPTLTAQEERAAPTFLPLFGIFLCPSFHLASLRAVPRSLPP